MEVNLTEVIKKLMAIHNVSVIEHKTPLKIENVDWGLRKNFYPDFDQQKLVNTFASTFEKNTLYILQDLFDVYYAAFITGVSPRSVVVVGPYRLTGFSFDQSAYVKKGFSGEQLNKVREYIISLPHIHEDIITRQLIAVLSVAVKDENVKIKHIKENILSENIYNQFSLVYSEDKPLIAMDAVEQRYNIENEILDAITMGNATKAKQVMRQLMKEDISDRYAVSLQQQKKSLIIINTLFRKAVEKANVHPYYIDELSYRFFQKIDIVSSGIEQIKLMDEMVSTYCEYAKMYSTEQYSAVVRKALNYIHLNISNRISLKDIAQHLKISSNYLARQFREETGKTVVEYINNTRIIVAANKLKQTSFSVAEIAESVGIHDTNYFSRIFRKYIGCSPTEFRQ